MDINDLLKLAIEHGASDLHLKAGCQPMLRLHGHLIPATEARLDRADTEAFAAETLTPAHRERFQKVQEVGSIRVSQRYFGAFRCFSWVI